MVIMVKVKVIVTLQNMCKIIGRTAEPVTWEYDPGYSVIGSKDVSYRNTLTKCLCAGVPAENMAVQKR